MYTYRWTGCCPALRARHRVLAVPADIGTRLTAIGDQEAQRKRDAAQGAPGYLQRPGLVALCNRRRPRRCNIRNGRILIRSRFQACRHYCGWRRGWLPLRLSMTIGLSAGIGPGAGVGPGAGIGLGEGFGPGVIDATGFGGFSSGTTFSGLFDGNGGLGKNHAISNLSLSSTSASNAVGLFPFIGTSGIVRNLTFTNASISSGNNRTPITPDAPATKIRISLSPWSRSESGIARPRGCLESPWSSPRTRRNRASRASAAPRSVRAPHLLRHAPSPRGSPCRSRR